MMNYLTSATLALILSNFFLIAQDGVPIKEPKWKQIAQAYGFIGAQIYSLNCIAAEYPDLAPEVRQASSEFGLTALGEGANELEGYLEKELGAEWPEIKSELDGQWRATVENTQFTRESAIQGLEVVRKRAKGDLPESIRNTLLANCPAFVKSPGAELGAGWVQNFSTLNHPKSTGANIAIKLPLSWTNRESTRDGVVKVFRSGAGNGPILLTISCFKALDDSEGEMSAEEMKELFTEAFIKDTIPEGAALIDGRPMMIAGKSGGMTIVDHAYEELDIKMKVRTTTFVIAHKHHMIHISFVIMGQFLEGMTFDEAQEAYFPTFRAIMSTLARN